jgi:predicted ABC-class ATPase
MAKGVVVTAPDSLAVILKQCDGTTIRGLGIKEGITLIVGGGFHGKSTLLHSIERGVYDHIKGDGREGIVTIEDAVKIRAEDRRAISQVDISPFISNLPQGKDTRCFSTQDASGSTSQAANIMEALSAGSQLLLIDEDTSATNFMIRDERMQALVAKDKEPITPLVQRIADLKSDNKVSVVLVMGGSGDFFTHADTVIMMDNYQMRDVTSQAHKLSKKVFVEEDSHRPIVARNARYITISSLNPNNELNKEKLQALETRILRYGKMEVDVSQIEQLVDQAQLSAIGYLIRFLYLNHQNFDTECTDLNQVLHNVMKHTETHGLDSITPYIIGTLAMPRLYELIATINRMRELKLS